jgi:hypothetical protein
MVFKTELRAISAGKAVVPPELIGRIAPTRTEGINLRDVFTFPIEKYQAQLLPSLPAAKSRAFGG